MGNFVEFAYDPIYDFNVKPKSKQGKVLILAKEEIVLVMGKLSSVDFYMLF